MDFKKLRLLALSFLALDRFRKPKATPESIRQAERREVSKAAAKRKPQPFRRPKHQRKKQSRK